MKNEVYTATQGSFQEELGSREEFQDMDPWSNDRTKSAMPMYGRGQSPNLEFDMIQPRYEFERPP